MRTIKQVMLISLVLILPFGHLFGQANPLARFNSLIGEWTGRGEGFGNDSSEINSVFRFVMGTTYIEVSNDSKFALSEKHPEGEHQTNKGYISYDNRRRVIVFRQFNNEGYVNIYLLNDSLSADSVFVFETKSIENFPPGGKARLTIKLIGQNQIETSFDVSFPNKGYSCFGKNKLVKTDTRMNSKSL